MVTAIAASNKTQH